MNGKKYLDSGAGTSGGRGARVWKGAALRIQPQKGEGARVCVDRQAIHCFQKLRQTQVGRRLLTYSSGLTNPTSLQGSLYWPESET